jgi:hypothetical protein
MRRAAVASVLAGIAMVSGGCGMSSAMRESGNHVRWSRRVSAIATVAIAVCLAGCSSGITFNSGPLGGQGSTGINCAPAYGRDGVHGAGGISFGLDDGHSARPGGRPQREGGWRGRALPGRVAAEQCGVYAEAWAAGSVAGARVRGYDGVGVVQHRRGGDVGDRADD